MRQQRQLNARASWMMNLFQACALDYPHVELGPSQVWLSNDETATWRQPHMHVYHPNKQPYVPLATAPYIPCSSSYVLPSLTNQQSS